MNNSKNDNTDQRAYLPMYSSNVVYDLQLQTRQIHRQTDTKINIRCSFVVRIDCVCTLKRPWSV